jgi:hypothetical protein
MEHRALVPRGASALRTPASAIVTLAVGLVSALAIASTLAVVLAVVLAAGHAIVEMPAVRRRRARNAALKARRTRRELREHRLEQANVPTCELEELAAIVEELDDSAAAEVEPLLDQYVAVAITRRRCAAVLDQGRPSQLEVQLAIARACHPHGAAVLERRIALGGVLANRMRQLDESAAEVAELIRYYAERSSLPETAPLLEPDPLGDALEAM